ncbi:MAG TPA: hypothetical protein VM869_28540 [Enhygromyxa sp.]|nr:hypothetical protein [Enhygromyxa sp.]
MNHIKTLICMGIAATLGATAWIATPTDAEARSQSAFLGGAKYGSQASCFYENAGGPLQWYCDGVKFWVIPLVYDNQGSMNIDVTARGALEGSHNVKCTAYSATSTGAVSVGSSETTVLNTGGTETLDVSVYAHGYGGTWVTCEMERYTRLINVTYSN